MTIWRNGTELMQFRIKVVMNQGGLGDMITRLPVLTYVLKNYPHIMMDVYWYNYFLSFAKRVIPDSPQINHRSMDDVNLFSPYPYTTVIDFKPHYISSLAMHLISHAFLTLLDRNPQLNECNYPQLAPSAPNTPPNLPPNYVVVTTGYTSATRHWKGKYVNDFVRLVKQKLELDVVFLGKADSALNATVSVKADFDDTVDYTQGLDLRDKTTLFEAVEVMRGARAVVGLDNGLTHLAATTDVPIVMGFTTVDPRHRLPIRHNELGWNVETVTPFQTLECRLCQSNMGFVKWDFRKCFYDDLTCLDHITGSRMFEALCKLLNKG